MASALGGIHASEDADSLPTAEVSHKREGAYYVWTFQEMQNTLTESELLLCSRYWNVRPDGNVDQSHDSQGELVGQNTLCVTSNIDDLAQELGISVDEANGTFQNARTKLLKYREKNRPRPDLDDKIVVSWKIGRAHV